MSDVKEFEGIKVMLVDVDGAEMRMCHGCIFNDNDDHCMAIQKIGDCGNQIYKQVEGPIKPIDECDLSLLRAKLKMGEYGGVEIMQAWIAIDELIELKRQSVGVKG